MNTRNLFVVAALGIFAVGGCNKDESKPAPASTGSPAAVTTITPPATSTAAKPPTPPATTVAAPPELPFGWSVYTSAAGGFSVAFPGQPKEFVKKDGPADIHAAGLEIDLRGPGDVYLVAYEDEPTAVTDVGKELDIDVLAYKKTNAKGKNFAVTNIELPDSKIKGRAVRCDMTEEGVTVTAEARFYQTEHRNWRVTVIVGDAASRARFLDSFKIVQR